MDGMETPSSCRLLFLADIWDVSMLLKINLQLSTHAYCSRTEQDNRAQSLGVTLLLRCKFFCYDQLCLIVMMRINLLMTFKPLPFCDSVIL